MGSYPYQSELWNRFPGSPRYPEGCQKKAGPFQARLFDDCWVGLEREAETAAEVGDIAAATEVVTPVGEDTDVVRDAVFDTGTHVTEADAVAVALEIRAAADHDIRSEMP